LIAGQEEDSGPASQLGANKVTTPSPADSATGQKSGGVDLSWVDPNDPDFDDYDVYFGPTGSMVLVETGYATKTLTITDDMILGQEYSWQSFAPPSTNLADRKRLIVVSYDQVWYEDI